MLGSFGTVSLSTYRNLEGEHPEAGDPEEGNSQRGYPEEENPVAGRPASSFDGFLTQVDFGVGDFGLSGNSILQSQSDSEDVGIAQETVAEELEDSQQPAQRVLPLPAHQVSFFQTQIEEDFCSASEGYEIIPDTSRRNSGRSRLSQAGASTQTTTNIPSTTQ